MDLLSGILAAVCVVAGSLAPWPRGTPAAERLSGALKMTAASAYVGFAVSVGAPAAPYGRWVLAALVLSWLGDLALIGAGGSAFVAGLAAFLLAHVAYAAAFLQAGVDPAAAAVGLAGMAAFAIAIRRWLARAGLPSRMRRPVDLYLAAIGLMVALAAGAAWAAAGGVTGSSIGGAVGGAALLPSSASVLLLGGALAFAASDVLVARHRFVRPHPLNRRIGLPLYFMAQVLLASTVRFAGA